MQLRRKKNKLQLELVRLHRLHTNMQRQMAQAAEMRFPNASYEKGWIDCLKYLNIPYKEDRDDRRHNMPSTQARQSSITERTDRRRSD